MDNGLLVEQNVDLSEGFTEDLLLGKVVGLLKGNLEGVLVELDDAICVFFLVGLIDVVLEGLLDKLDLEDGAE